MYYIICFCFFYMLLIMLNIILILLSYFLAAWESVYNWSYLYSYHFFYLTSVIHIDQSIWMGHFPQIPYIAPMKPLLFNKSDPRFIISHPQRVKGVFCVFKTPNMDCIEDLLLKLMWYEVPYLISEISLQKKVKDILLSRWSIMFMISVIKANDVLKLT